MTSSSLDRIKKEMVNMVENQEMLGNWLDSSLLLVAVNELKANICKSNIGFWVVPGTTYFEMGVRSQIPVILRVLDMKKFEYH